MLVGLHRSELVRFGIITTKKQQHFKQEKNPLDILFFIFLCCFPIIGHMRQPIPFQIAHANS